MKRKLGRMAAVLGAVSAVLALILAVLLLNPPRNAETGVVLTDRAPTEIVLAELENTAGGLRVHAENGGFVLDGVPSEVVDIDRFISFLETCARIRDVRVLPGKAQDLSAYGLDSPRAHLRCTYADGGFLDLSVGSPEPVSGEVYARVEGTEGILLLSAETADTLLQSKENLISFYVTPELKVSSALSAVLDAEFSGGNLAEPVSIESVSAGGESVREEARSFGAATHLVRGAGVHELDQTYGLTVLAPLCGMRADAILRYGLSAEEEDALGFADPYFTASFDYRNGGGDAEHYDLRFLPADEEGTSFFVNAMGSGLVYLVKRPAFLDISYEKLILRWFLSPMLMDITGITVETDGKDTRFDVDSTDPKNPVVLQDGMPMDSDVFRKLFSLLISAAADGSYLGPDRDPGEKRLMTVTYHYPDGKPDDVLLLCPGGTRRDRVYVNGISEFAMKETFRQRVTEALSAIAEGRDFDINW